VSLVCFPFKTEDVSVVARNLEIAATHPRIERVLCVGFEENETYERIADRLPAISGLSGTPIDLILQRRIGDRRPGKGDGMNTALQYFVDETDLERIHFYDSDITSFGAEWITKAEDAADFDYCVVRHYFPRASTDAMITWLITRVGFALVWPRSELAWIEQPLGGELLFTREAATRLVGDDRVRAQSDWGIDTLYTFATVQYGCPIYESYVSQGKAHRLYGRLTDLKTMLVECFAALQGLRAEIVPEHSPHRIEYPDVVPHAIAEKLGYNVEATMQLLTERWTQRQRGLLDVFPVTVQDGMEANRHRITFAFMDEAHWYEVYSILLDEFVPGDPDWEELLFKLWTMRVLHYTTTSAIRGYSYAQRDLHAMIGRYLRRSAMGLGTVG
jgi:mannosylglycerate synthase